jgi:hypothetical protein
VARIGRYKALISVALFVLALGLFLLTHLRADTPLPLLWLWMAVTGIGIGPAFAVFTLAVQNAVPVRQLGVGTSGLTLFQQVGGTVGLAITGTIFGSRLLEEMPRQIAAAGVPPQFADQFAQGGAGTLNQVSGVGDLGARILAQVPEAARAAVEPLIPAIVKGIHEAFSIAIASTFVVGIISALVGGLVVLFVLPAGQMGVREGALEPAMAPPAGELEPSD